MPTPGKWSYFDTFIVDFARSLYFLKKSLKKTCAYLHKAVSLCYHLHEKIKNMNTDFQNFFAETKKIFKSCTFACVNIHGRNVWGDFRSKKEAKNALKMWSVAFKGQCKAEVVEGKYRISVSF